MGKARQSQSIFPSLLLREPWPSAKASSLSVMPVFCYGYVNGILAHIRFDEQYDRIFMARHPNNLDHLFEPMIVEIRILLSVRLRGRADEFAFSARKK